MPNSKMSLFLSTAPAEGRWGEQALLSANNQGITLHLPALETRAAVQQAGRRLDSEGVRHVELAGTGWDLAYCWAFWQGFRSANQAQQVVWPTLTPEEQQELTYRLDIIDWMRDLINLAPADLSPEQLAQQAITLLQRFDKNAIQYRLITGEALQTEGYHGIYAVGRGSVRPPALLALDYNPSGDSSAPILACLVGKGITFDSGGYNLKTAEAMQGMKGDMGGAALVTASLALAVARGLQHRVKLYLCCADNLVSGNAYKMDDIIRYRNGKSVEVMNTDAEGRLVLADGLIEASAQKAKYLIDCATLTGAAKIALGNDYHGLFSFDEPLSAQFLATAAEQNEPFWRLPLAELHRQQLSSPFADLSNISTTLYSAGASTAAAFLSHFVTPYQQGWLHIDCAANYRKKAVKQWAAGATGLGVLTLSELLSKLAG